MQPPPVGYAGDNLVVFGYSQSATIATDKMRNLRHPATLSSLLSSPTALPQDFLDLLGGSGWSSLSSDLLGWGSELASMLQGLDLPSSLLAVPDALGFALDPTLLLSPLALLGF
jgi:PE-PPE domain